MIRKLGLVITPLAVLLFTAAFIHAVTHDTASSCYGADCVHGEGRWVIAFPGSILAFVAGVLCLAYGGKGMGRAQGPQSFEDVKAGRGSVPDAPDGSTGRPPKRWTKSWANAYTYTALGELFLGGLFVYAGFATPDGRGAGFLTGGILGGIGLIFLAVGRGAARRDRLHDTGLHGTATIVGIFQTGLWANNNPVAVLTLDVQVEGYPSYRIKHREVVPQVMLGRLATGAALPVSVDPDNPSKVVIDWQSA